MINAISFLSKQKFQIKDFLICAKCGIAKWNMSASKILVVAEQEEKLTMRISQFCDTMPALFNAKFAFEPIK